MNPYTVLAQRQLLKICLLLFLGGIFPLIAKSQVIPADFVEETAGKLSETTTGEADLSDLADDLERLKEHPINLNKATPEELNQLSFLSEAQINNLWSYIKTYGTLYTISELQAVTGFDSITIHKVMPFVYIGDPPQQHPIKLKDLINYGRSDLIVRCQQVLQRSKGYKATDSLLSENPDAGYSGSPQRYSFRYKYSFYDRFGFGIAGEKDPGEQFFRGGQRLGMDFYSGYITLMNTGILKNLVVGNFRAGFGQGLVLGNGFSFSTVPGAGTLRRSSGGIRPGLSTSETGYLRGVAATVRFRKFEVTGFYSDHKTDGNPAVTDSVSKEVLEVSSMDGTGYHRLSKELENRNIIREIITGGNINFRNNRFTVGLTGFYSHWSASLNPGLYPYNLFSFRGSENINLGIDFQFTVKNIYFFGEAGRSRNGGLAWLLGGQFSPDPLIAFTLLYRDYQRNYQDLLGNAIGRNSANANETGIMATVTTFVIPGLTLSAYADLYRFPWLKYQVDFSTQGSEYQVRADYTAIRKVPMYLRIRIRNKEANIPGTTEHMSRLSTTRTISLRYQADLNISASMIVKNRVEILENKMENASGKYGYLMSQSLSLKPVSARYSVHLLYALFDTDTYSERLYAYENDVLYGYSVPSYYGRGIRFGILADITFFRRFTLWVKYSQTCYTDRNVIGTGLDEIEGNLKSEMTIQFRIKF